MNGTNVFSGRVPLFRLSHLICYGVTLFLPLWCLGLDMPMVGTNYFMIGTVPLYILGPTLLVNKRFWFPYKGLFVIFVLFHAVYFNPAVKEVYSIHFVFQLAACLVYYFLLINLVDSFVTWGRMINLLIVGTVLITSFLIYKYAFVYKSIYLSTYLTYQEHYYIGRGGKNTLAFMLVLFLPFAYAKFSYQKHNLLNLVAVLIIAGGALYTISRMAFLSVMATPFFFCLFSIRRGIFVKQAAVFGLLLMLLKGIWGLGADDFLWMRSAAQRERQRVASGQSDFFSAGHRWRLLEEAMEGFVESPLIGHGVASFRTKTSGSVSHNDYVQIAYEFGLLGIVLFALIFLVLFVDLLRHRPFVPPPHQWLWDAQVVALMNMAVLLMTINAYQTIPFWFIWTGCSVVVACARNEYARSLSGSSA